ncbi:glycosyltransferase family 4 protein [Allorhodopirellula heiligendammensis]|uniref:Alpha-D-kanosaminyltransferase n=1 Tax=Allorhodopirellula heiligendammensis TaxID=2714739 RepID=A0A5C6C997_9BACT|nr:glycosyltransferase family 4 protein [Allorhodopirellula heiligendammensis]TWU19996.1 Alpha-D-kanosaminyltransferase [Allorhodopirellula heiligendammensis]
MKILYHHRTRGDGAEGVHINEMIGAFRELRHEVSIAAPRGATKASGLAASQPSRPPSGFKVFLKQTAEIFYNVVDYFRVRAAVKKAQPDFIYERYSSYDFAGVMAAKHLKIPIIVEVNVTYAGRFGARFPVIYRGLLKRAESYVLQHADGIVVVSEALKECVLDVRKDDATTIVTPNAINLTQIKKLDHHGLRTTMRAELDVEDKIVIGFVGSLRKWHGIDFFADAMTAIVSQTKNVYFLIVGSGEYEDTLKAKIKDAKLEEHVNLVGPVAHDQVYSYIAAMDVGVMPDSNEFGSPMKILEYMAMECVAVGPDLGPIHEIIRDGETGCIFKRRDQADFVSVLINLCDNVKRRKQIGENARRDVLNERTWNRNASDVLDLFQHFRTVC